MSTAIRVPGLVVLLAILALACGPSGSGDDDDDGDDASADADGGVSGGGDGGGAVDECTDGIDVVFVLDVSSSMSFVLEELEANIAEVVAAANQLAPGAHFGMISFADNAAFDLGGDLEGGKVHTQAATLTTAFATARSVYTANNRNPGDGPGGPTTQNPICEENAPDALFLATEFPWRADATRVVIVATDDTFLAPPDNYGDRDADGDTSSTDFPREGNYPAQHGIVDTTAALTAAEIRVFAFNRTQAPSLLDPTACGTPRRHPWSAIGDGWSTPFDGAPAFPLATDGGSFSLDSVRSGNLALAATINQIVLGSHCDPIE